MRIKNFYSSVNHSETRKSVYKTNEIFIDIRLLYIGISITQNTASVIKQLFQSFQNILWNKKTIGNFNYQSDTSFKNFSFILIMF